MATCFVIQPFDAGKYDKRYEDVYSPAIIDADLEPYRVDKDPSADVPIEAIEKGIRSAACCLADITTDNPNVWYELGFAFATGCPVVMVCSEERVGKYPFDIQHRHIIKYRAESPRDFQALQSEITTRLKAYVSRTAALAQLHSEQIAPRSGLTQQELAVLTALAGSVVSLYETAAAYAIKNAVERAGFTAMSYNIGVKRLADKGFIEEREMLDSHETYQAFSITGKGWDWIEQNEDQFLLQAPTKEPPADPSREPDIPF